MVIPVVAIVVATATNCFLPNSSRVGWSVTLVSASCSACWTFSNCHPPLALAMKHTVGLFVDVERAGTSSNKFVTDAVLGVDVML